MRLLAYACIHDSHLRRLNLILEHLLRGGSQAPLDNFVLLLLMVGSHVGRVRCCGLEAKKLAIGLIK